MEALHPFGAILSAGTCKLQGGQGWQAGSTGRGSMVLVLLPVEAQAYLHPSCPGGGLNTAVDLLMGAGGLLQRLGQWAVVSGGASGFPGGVLSSYRLSRSSCR